MPTRALQWPQRRWATENAEGLGRHLTSWLLGGGEQVVDGPITATARVLRALLAETVGVGPIMAGRLTNRTSRASRFPTTSM